MFVGDVVGKLELMERHDLAHPLFAGERRVGVDVHAFRHLRVGLAGHHPARVVELVAAVVHRNDVNQHDVLGALVEARHLDLERWKHPPAKRHNRPPTVTPLNHLRYKTDERHRGYTGNKSLNSLLASRSLLYSVYCIREQRCFAVTTLWSTLPPTVCDPSLTLDSVLIIFIHHANMVELSFVRS